MGPDSLVKSRLPVFFVKVPGFYYIFNNKFVF